VYSLGELLLGHAVFVGFVCGDDFGFSFVGGLFAEFAGFGEEVDCVLVVDGSVVLGLVAFVEGGTSEHELEQGHIVGEVAQMGEMGRPLKHETRRYMTAGPIGL
jgi:hypothetical protein